MYTLISMSISTTQGFYGKISTSSEFERILDFPF